MIQVNAGYSGQSADQLLSLEGMYRIDSLVRAFEQAITQKAQRGGVQSLTDEERIVLAVEALEREVNNGVWLVSSRSCHRAPPASNPSGVDRCRLQTDPGCGVLPAPTTFADRDRLPC